MKLFILIASISCLSCISTWSEICSNPDEICMHKSECPKEIQDQLKMKRRPEEISKSLRKARCGVVREKKLCCRRPECYTWDGRPGECKPYSKGGTNMTHRQLKFSRCTKKQGVFICQSKFPVRQTGDCNSDISAFPPDPMYGCCGKDRSGASRIIGGSGTALDAFPWLAVIQYEGNMKNCSGALISGRYVLTAAHCVDYTSPKATAVVLGEHDKRSTYDCDENDECVENKELTIDIEDIIVHEDFEPTNPWGKNDIALLRLAKMATYSDFILPICLPIDATDMTKRPPLNFKLWSAGWGDTNATYHSPSDIKRKVELPYVNPQECVDKTKYLWSKQMCAGGEENKDSCSGDSGSPLMYDRNGIYEALGITSFGIAKCGTPGIPAIYTKVFSYSSWIHSKLRP